MKRPQPNREATSETLKKCRRDEILYLFNRGFLEKHHVEAADEIECIVEALNRASCQLTMLYEPREYDIPKKYHGKTPMDAMTSKEVRLYRTHYLPWRAEMSVKVPARAQITKFDLVMAVIRDNLGVSAVERAYGLPRGNKVVSKHLRAALGKYATIAGIKPPDIGGRSRNILKKSLSFLTDTRKGCINIPTMGD